MYHSRAGASLNVSAKGEGNAVLIKSAVPYGDDLEERACQTMLSIMQALNPQKNGQQRNIDRLCSGQALLCRSLGLKILDWDAKQFDPERFYIRDVDYVPQHIIV